MDHYSFPIRKVCPEDGCVAAPADQRDASREGRCLTHRDLARTRPDAAPRRVKPRPDRSEPEYYLT